MNNSDIIAALSLAITAIIFLIQTDDGLLRLKIRKSEKWWLLGILIMVIFLVNHEIFERFHFSFYFTIFKKYLQPTEWALLFFLIIIGITLSRIFNPRIYNENSKVILNLTQKYRQEKKWVKLQNLLLQIMDLKDFEDVYAEPLNDTIFNDYHLIEYFASDYPEILIKFSYKYGSASINQGEHFFYILNGLFADKSNPIFSEIRNYHNDPEKNIFLDDHIHIRFQQDFKFDKNKNYKTTLPIIAWLSWILESYPTDFKEEIKYFLNQFPPTSQKKNNKTTYSANEIDRTLSRDTVYNAIRLFRILLLEFSLNNKNALLVIDRPLLMFYSSWDFVQKFTTQQTDKVALNNDAYTINEYFLKYLFSGYLSLFFILQYRKFSGGDKEEHSAGWPLKQLFAKLDSIIGHENIVSEKSKEYYIETLFSLYFDMPEYFKDSRKEGDETGEVLLWYIKDSLESSPYGDVDLFRNTFYEVCSTFDFIPYSSIEELKKRKHFYTYLLPYTADYEWRIVRS